jgi:TonB-linked SusC/RagA family outer membrane protein
MNSMKNAKFKELVNIMMLSAFFLVTGIVTANARGGDSQETPELQQSKTRITGTVVDQAGEPVIGANIVEKGVTANGTVTDRDGNFNLNISPRATLVVSYIGYVTQEIAVENRTELQIILREDLQALNEVVVVGYGYIRKEAVTGAVARANLETFKDVPTNNILEKVKGALPGLNIGGTNRAGQVGDMMIRGQNSTGGNSPLVVVDGAIFAGSLADISPNDIETFTILKDASAAAVYGSRSANGVILIETKRGAGKNGKPVFNLNLNYGLSNELKHLKVYGPDAYLQRVLDIREANDLEADPSKIDIYLTDEERKNYNATPDHRPTVTDPYSITTQPGYNRNVSFSVANRMDKTRYYIATSFIDQRGVEINDQYKYLSVRVNIDSDITGWLNVGMKSFYSFRDNSGTPPPNTKAHFSPWSTLKNEDGTYMYAPQTTTSFVNPFWEMATDDVKQRNNLNGILTATVKAPWIQGLTYTSTLSNTLRWENDNQFWDKYTTTGSAVNGVGWRQAVNMYNLLWDNIVKYNNTFEEKHYVDVTLLFSQEKYTWEQVRARAQDFDNLILGTYRLEDGKTQSAETGGSASESLGLMARGTYTYDNKYSITGTIRRDGFSAFSKNKKYGTFPSMGVNWNISREGFMKEIASLDNLAFRATYGSNGNQSISLYQTLAKIATDKYIYAGQPSYVVTQYISSLATDDLSWETTTGLNLGLDFGWLNNRINGAIDLYLTKTNNLLFSLDLPKTSGMNSITSNVGEIQNRGFEVTLNTLNIDHPDFKWSSNFTFSLNRNKIVSILGDDSDGDGKEDDLVSSGYFIGKSLETIYDYKVLGMYQQADVDNGTIMNGWRPGEYILEDLDNSGTITSDKDRQILGSRKENFRWSFTNTFGYKGFTLMAHLYSIWGGHGWFLSNNNFPSNNYAARSDINHPVFDYWTPRNTGAFFQRPDYGRRGAVTGKKLIDRSFIKLQKISLTYDIGQWVKPWGMNGLTVGASADNVFTYAPYWIGLDPETNQGITDNAIPSLRTYNFSVTINF